MNALHRSQCSWMFIQQRTSADCGCVVFCLCSFIFICFVWFYRINHRLFHSCQSSIVSYCQQAHVVLVTATARHGWLSNEQGYINSIIWYVLHGDRFNNSLPDRQRSEVGQHLTVVWNDNHVWLHHWTINLEVQCIVFADSMQTQ